jgi:hypothetical protein
MSLLLFIVGAIALMVGLGMAAYGIPINEFSFGNTLIVAGMTTASGGLVVIALAAVVRELQRLADMQGARAPARTGQSFEAPAATPAAPPPARLPFPPKTRPETRAETRAESWPEPAFPEAPASEQRMAPPAAMDEVHPGQSFAPTLRNPEAPPLTLDDEVSLSPQHPNAAPAPPPGAAEPRREPAFEPPWRSPPPRQPAASNFEAMWPAEPKPSRGDIPSNLPPNLPPMGRPERPPREPAARPGPSEMPAAETTRNVAILKSGVVDGMAYTLYVDGSIEAELPQGTLHFASIDALRSHLDNNA